MGGRLKDLWEPSWETVAADCQEPGMRLGAGAGAGHGPDTTGCPQPSTRQPASQQGAGLGGDIWKVSETGVG